MPHGGETSARGVAPRWGSAAVLRPTWTRRDAAVIARRGVGSRLPVSSCSEMRLRGWDRWMRAASIRRGRRLCRPRPRDSHWVLINAGGECGNRVFAATQSDLHVGAAAFPFNDAYLPVSSVLPSAFLTILTEALLISLVRLQQASSAAADRTAANLDSFISAPCIFPRPADGTRCPVARGIVFTVVDGLDVGSWGLIAWGNPV